VTSTTKSKMGKRKGSQKAGGPSEQDRLAFSGEGEGQGGGERRGLKKGRFCAFLPNRGKNWMGASYSRKKKKKKLKPNGGKRARENQLGEKRYGKLAWSRKDGGSPHGEVELRSTKKEASTKAHNPAVFGKVNGGVTRRKKEEGGPSQLSMVE